ncbi:MAG: hypothetical protein ABF759_13695, partial [Acetobacter malorum]|uniref:hypothetical protein n=1 Tax=Acetobacter malorum TaxID=178901 RepID=UPI0039EB5877
HDPTSTPASSGRHPEAVRMTLLNGPHTERAGFLFAEIRKNEPLYVENVDEDRKYLISERQMIVLLQFLAGDLLEKRDTTQPIDLLSWRAGFLEQSQPGWQMGQSSPWNFRLLLATPKVDPSYQEESRPLSQSPKHHDGFGDPSTSHNISSESSSHVCSKCMMDVAGSGDNAAASDLHGLAKTLYEKQFATSLEAIQAIGQLENGLRSVVASVGKVLAVRAS